MKICIGSDHGGYELKEYLKTVLKKDGYEVLDVGCNSKDSVHYPIYGQAVAKKVSSDEFEKGILICTTGIGMSMTANRFKGVRAALCHNEDSAKMSRLHNNSNILVFGAKYQPPQQAEKILKVWLNTGFEAGRHLDRIKLIDNK